MGRTAVSWIAALSVVMVHGSAFADGAADAKASLTEADRAVKTNDFAKAAQAFRAAHEASPSARALEGLAQALYQGGKFADSYVSYTDWMVQYGSTAPAAKKKVVEARLKELIARTGALTITTNESGAEVRIDDVVVGTSPLSAPIRLSIGSHRVRITKSGFLPFDASREIAKGSTVTVDATLERQSTKATVTVKEASGKPVRVFADNVDVGDAPWTGEVESGSHAFALRGPGLGAEPTTVELERGTTKELELRAEPLVAPVKFVVSDGKGLLVLDGKPVGEGTFYGDLPAGIHVLKVLREGYDPFEESFEVKPKQALSRTITLTLSTVVTTGQAAVDERVDGIYGGVGLGLLFTPGGTGSSVQSACESRSADSTLLSCDAPDGLGGGLSGYVGYQWDPVGLELALAAHYDQRRPMNTWGTDKTDPGIGPDPARREAFTLLRAGGSGQVRIRVSHQWSKVRLSFATGAGVAWRVLALLRDTTATDGSGARDAFVSNAPTYLSPTVSMEPGVSYRLTPRLGVALTLQASIETPSSFMNGHATPQTKPEVGHLLNGRSLYTRSYELASGVQWFVGPALGLTFGP